MRVTILDVAVLMFVVGVLVLGYMHIQDERYSDWAKCWQWYIGQSIQSTDGLDICDAVMTHKFNVAVEPLQ